MGHTETAPNVFNSPRYTDIPLNQWCLLTIDVRITRIRKKIEIDAEKPQVLKTVRGAGYMFVQEGRKA